MLLLSVIASAFVAGSAWAQTVVPFTVDGPLEEVTATSADVFNTGGMIKVYGDSIVIPENLIVQFPAAFIPFQEFVQDYAKDPSVYQGYEVAIDGNRVNNVPIAGRVFMTRLIAGSGAGVIGSVNTDGTMKILGGPLLRINTPNGVYAAACNAHPFLTADEENPSISSFSGYPMCIPRSSNDPDCPASNRAADGSLVYTPANTSAMAPFLAGDYITWDGVKNGPNEVLAYAVVAEAVQQLTKADSGDPVYVRVEDIVYGINDATTNTEFAQTKVVGYVSDATVGITVHRLDVDPCTGEETEVQIASGSPKAGDVRNKFDIRFTDLKVSKATREYRVRASKGQKVVAMGIEAGQYVSPMTELVWPEVNLPGTVFPPLAFETLGHLKDGIVQDNKQYGQLKPWPGASAPTPIKKCTGKELDAPTPPSYTVESPLAFAGAALVDQLAGSLVTVTGINNNTALADTDITFAWSGPSDLTINNANKATANFVLPWQNPSTTPTLTRELTLKICLIRDTSICSTSTRKVTTSKFVDTLAITSYQYQTKQSGTVAISATSNIVLRGTNAANLQVQLSNGAWVNMVQDTSNAAIWSYNNKNIGRQPTRVAVRSKNNQTPVTTTTFVKRVWRALRA